MSDWFCGGVAYRYHRLSMCMGNDMQWITITVITDILVMICYLIIGHHWWSNAKNLPWGPAKGALLGMLLIFVFCAFCGYGGEAIRVWWPCYRLVAILKIALVAISVVYLWIVARMDVIYDLRGDAKLIRELLEKTEENDRLKEEVSRLQGL